MCSPISDGAAAIVLCNAKGLKRLNGAATRAVRVLSSVAQLQTGSSRGIDEHEKDRRSSRRQKAYEEAGVAPSDIDVAEVHDASAMGEILNVESLMLVPFGEGGAAAERGDLTVGGGMPVNPSGGLESKGHPIGCSLGQLHELVTQLTRRSRSAESKAVRTHRHPGKRRPLRDRGSCGGGFDPRKAVSRRTGADMGHVIRTEEQTAAVESLRRFLAAEVSRSSTRNTATASCRATRWARSSAS